MMSPYTNREYDSGHTNYVFFFFNFILQTVILQTEYNLYKLHEETLRERMHPELQH